MSPHLFVDISAHGFGHLAQTAPVLAELRRRRPDVHLIVRCALAKRLLLTRIDAPFTHLRDSSDFGYRQHDAVSIDHAASRAAYEEAHGDWEARVARETEFLQRLRPDLVLANVAYLPLAGAKRAGIPALAMSSLNWAELARHFYRDEPWAAPILAQMTRAYRDATATIALTPAMVMADWPDCQRVGPVARLAAPEARGRMRQALGVKEGQRLVLVAMGGFDLDLPTDRWPHRDDLVYLMPEAWDCAHPAARRYSQTEQDFTELLQAADAVLTKPGYGTFTEAACNGTPLLYLRREDWPEQEALIDWLAAAGRCREVSRQALVDGEWIGDLNALLAEPTLPPVIPTGIKDAVDVIGEKLFNSSS